MEKKELEKAKELFKELIDLYELDVDELTPERLAHFWRDNLSGAKEPPDIKLFPTKHNEMVIERGIKFTSYCRHHLLPFQGTVDIGYIPNGQIIGLSRLIRIVNYFSNRTQLQEDLTSQIADYLFEDLQFSGTGVVIKARHSCMEILDSDKRSDSETVTSAVRGLFMNNYSVKEEFQRLIK